MSVEPARFEFDLGAALDAVVSISTKVPPDGLTASVLGTERAGHGVLIDRGLVLTIGYLITEAQQIWIGFRDGRTVPGDVLGYDQATGFGLVQLLARVETRPVPLGSSREARVGDHVVVAGSGGPDAVIEARLVAKQEFAGYWEYLLDEALFTAPAHPNWGGTAVLDSAGRLIGLGSLQIQDALVNGQSQDLNMIVPIDLLKDILPDLKTRGQADRPPRPWLGLYATEVDDHVVVLGLADNGPAVEAGVASGDVVVAVGNQQVDTLAGFYRAVWATGEAGCDVILSLVRDGRVRQVIIGSADRAARLKRPLMH